jgi:DNA-binding transcriptional LysR family regulator
MAWDSADAIDLKRMRMVLEVARAEAITAAAQVLGLTQPAVSRGIAEVEHALGVRIFERVPRGIRLTEGGERFVARARRILTEVEDLFSEVREERGRVSGRLRVGITISGVHAAFVLGSFARAHPDVGIETATGSPQELCPRLLRGDLDVILGSSTYLRRWRDLDVTVLAPLYLATMLRKDHPLASYARPKEVDVLRYPAIVSEIVEPAYSDLAQRYVHHALPRFQPHYVTDDFDLVQRLVHRTDAYFPLTSLNEAFLDLGRRFLLLRDVLSLQTHHVSFARAANRAPSPALQVLGELLVERVGRAASAARPSAVRRMPTRKVRSRRRLEV